MTHALGPRLSDRAFQDRLDQHYPDDHAKQRALRRLHRLMDTQGHASLPGGVRGWADALGCGRGYPREMLELMAADGTIALDILREPGGWLAQIVVLIAFAPADRSADDSPSPPTDPPTDPAPHQDAENKTADRSAGDPPLHPPYGTHDSMQQQQHAHARESGLADRAAQFAELRAAFPTADARLLAAWEAQPLVYSDAARAALTRRPVATLAEWRQDLLVAETERTEVEWPIAFVLAIWADGGRVSRRRSTLADRAREASQRQQVAPPEPPEPDNAPGRGVEPPPVPASRIDPEERRLDRIWQTALGTVQLTVSRQEFDTWLRGTRLAALEGPLATVSVSTPWQRDGVDTRYVHPLRRALVDVLGHPVQLRVVVAGKQLAAAAAD